MRHSHARYEDLFHIGILVGLIMLFCSGCSSHTVKAEGTDGKIPYARAVERPSEMAPAVAGPSASETPICKTSVFDTFMANMEGRQQMFEAFTWYLRAACEKEACPFFFPDVKHLELIINDKEAAND